MKRKSKLPGERAGRGIVRSALEKNAVVITARIAMSGNPRIKIQELEKSLRISSDTLHRILKEKGISFLQLRADALLSASKVAELKRIAENPWPERTLEGVARHFGLSAKELKLVLKYNSAVKTAKVKWLGMKEAELIKQVKANPKTKVILEIELSPESQKQGYDSVRAFAEAMKEDRFKASLQKHLERIWQYRHSKLPQTLPIQQEIKALKTLLESFIESRTSTAGSIFERKH